MKNNLAKDSIILAIVRVVTICTSILQTMFLSRLMTLTEYGIYSQLLIVISIATTVSSLGLNNAINFFYNKENREEKKRYVDTIFALTIIIGVIISILILLCRDEISAYYENSELIHFMIYIAVRPVFANIVLLYQSLYISVGRTKVVAGRNFIISMLQVICIPLAFYLYRSIRIVLIVGLLLDIVQIIYFGYDFNKKNILIQPYKIDRKIITKILTYSIPLALATMIGTLFKESDKLIVARLTTVEELAIYTNMSKQLPFEFIALSFTSVISPYIVKLINNNRKEHAIELWADYMEFGYVTTWILCGGAILCAAEVLKFLYSDVYISGLNIFIIYLFVEMFRYTYFGMILSSTGKTKSILISSIGALIFNVIFNIVFWHIFGIIGPAIASLVCTIAMGLFQLILSCRELKIALVKALRLKNMLIVLVKLIISAIVLYFIKVILYKFIKNYIIILIIVYGLFVVIGFLLNKNRIIYLVRNMKGGDEL